MNLITCKPWGETANGPVYLFRLTNASGAFVEITNYGATLVSACVPDRHGKLANVVLGYDSLQGYEADPNYMGATIGRFANRISDAAFELDGRHYRLEANDGSNSNHGGSNGFHRQTFLHETGERCITLRYTSPGGEGGFPGTLQLAVRYEWTEDNALMIHYQATTDQPTVASFTNHAYFNLSGKTGLIDGHELHILAQNILETGADHIPTGAVIPAGILSFNGNNVGQKIQKENGNREGLNTCYILEKQADKLSKACQLTDPETGRALTVHTSYPGLLLYTGDYISGGTHRPFEGLCLECQHFPDAPNQPAFPSAVLRPGEVYDHTILFHFT
ncbi:aldose 1-epimerase [Dyadobacter soli]|uniref:Aldose 1-epimerase n=1 Tax=Dyadobacter soli TaxID=659014 RepID=A0A1G7PYS3_9BACT|nr:aldose epimerase family protein [Dyadobacter soli]SDF91358.1 aldose 1-epimerase [Dyadobacter soli]